MYHSTLHGMVESAAVGSISGVPHVQMGDERLGQGRYRRRNLDRNRSAEATGHNSTAAHVAANPGTGQPGGSH